MANTAKSAYKSITLTIEGITFDTAFTTVVTKVVNPDKDSKIVVDALRNIQLSLGGESAASLGIEKDTQVIIKPIDGSTNGSFILEVGKKVEKARVPESRGSSPIRGTQLSNSLR